VKKGADPYVVICSRLGQTNKTALLVIKLLFVFVSESQLKLRTPAILSLLDLASVSFSEIPQVNWFRFFLVSIGSGVFHRLLINSTFPETKKNLANKRN